MPVNGALREVIKPTLLQLPGGPIVQFVIACAHKQLAAGNSSVLVPTPKTSRASALGILVGTSILGNFIRRIVDASKYLLEPRDATAVPFWVERREFLQDPTGTGSSASSRPTNRLARSTHSIASLP